MSKISIEGIALVEGISRNRVKYTPKEMQAFSGTLKGRPILKDHVNETDNAVGLVEDSTYFIDEKDGLAKVRYKGWVKEDGSGIVDRMKDGRIKEVSIGAVAGRMVKESEDSDYQVAKGLVALELSTTPCPGVVGTSLKIGNSVNKKTEEKMMECPECGHKFSSKMMEEKMAKCPSCGYKWSMETASQEKSYSQLNVENINNQKEVKMESGESKNENVSISQESVKLAEALKTLEAKEKEIADMKEAQRQEAIATYKGLCESKSVKAIDLSNATMETIKALTETVKSIEVKKAEEKVAEKAKVETKTTEVVATESIDEKMKGYTIEHSSLGGFAFFKTY